MAAKAMVRGTLKTYTSKQCILCGKSTVNRCQHCYKPYCSSHIDIQPCLVPERCIGFA